MNAGSHTPGDPNVATEIEIVGNESVIVHWEDGHVSEFPCQMLRAKCPCATCINEEEPESSPIGVGMSLPIISPKAKPGIHPKGIEPVGHYAVKIDWSDNHQAGIYSFTYLRSICPCSTCRN